MISAVRVRRSCPWPATVVLTSFEHSHSEPNTTRMRIRSKQLVLPMIQSNRVRFRVDPRDVPLEKAARRLHLTAPEFRAKLPALLARGFPQPDATTGMFDLAAIDQWMTDRHNPNPGPCALTVESKLRNAQEVLGDRRGRPGGQG